MQVAGKWVDSSDISLAQYCSELKALCDNLPLMQAALPVDASCEDIGIDPHLPFLDDFVGRALQNGAQPYLSRSALPQAVQGSLEAGSKHEEGALNFEAYAKPAAPQQRPMQYELPPTEQQGLEGGGGGEAGGSGLNV